MFRQLDIRAVGKLIYYYLILHALQERQKRRQQQQKQQQWIAVTAVGAHTYKCACACAWSVEWLRPNSMKSCTRKNRHYADPTACEQQQQQQASKACNIIMENEWLVCERSNICNCTLYVCQKQHVCTFSSHSAPAHQTRQWQTSLCIHPHALVRHASRSFTLMSRKRTHSLTCLLARSLVCFRCCVCYTR